MNQTEEELEKFRQTWREEVSSRRRSQHRETRIEQSSSGQSADKQTWSPKPSVRHIAGHHDTEFEPRTYHDIEEKDGGRRIGDEKSSIMGVAGLPSPKTALEHYERAVEKEGQGSLGESLAHYRKAFKVGGPYHLLKLNA
jgi:F-box protein 9